MQRGKKGMATCWPFYHFGMSGFSALGVLASVPLFTGRTASFILRRVCDALTRTAVTVASFFTTCWRGDSWTSSGNRS
jgi:hypothetical protein